MGSATAGDSTDDGRERSNVPRRDKGPRRTRTRTRLASQLRPSRVAYIRRPESSDVCSRHPEACGSPTARRGCHSGGRRARPACHASRALCRDSCSVRASATGGVSIIFCAEPASPHDAPALTRQWSGPARARRVQAVGEGRAGADRRGSLTPCRKALMHVEVPVLVDPIRPSQSLREEVSHVPAGTSRRRTGAGSDSPSPCPLPLGGGEGSAVAPPGRAAGRSAAGAERGAGAAAPCAHGARAVARGAAGRGLGHRRAACAGDTSSRLAATAVERTRILVVGS